MIVKYSFACAVCGKEYVVNGKWWNQWVMRHWNDYRYFIHKCIQHKKKMKISDALRMTFLWIPLIILQVISILLKPVSIICEFFV